MNIECLKDKIIYKIKFFFWRTFFAKNTLPPLKNVNMFSDNTSVFSDNTDYKSASVIFIGDSVTFLANWSKAFSDIKVANFGIGGNNTQDVLNRLNQLEGANPEKIFLRIGINDLQGNMIPCEYQPLYYKLIVELITMFPTAKLYIMSLLPTGKEFEKLRYDIKDRIVIYNVFLYSIICKNPMLVNLKYIHDHSLFVNDEGWSKPEYVNDGIHPSVAGYQVIFENIKNYLN